ELIEECRVVVGFLAHLDHAFIGPAAAGAAEARIVGGENADLPEGLAALVERLGVFTLLVHGTDQCVGGGVRPAAWRQLVADGVAATEGLRAEALELERRLRFDAAKIAPHLLEASGHAEP